MNNTPRIQLLRFDSHIKNKKEKKNPEADKPRITRCTSSDASFGESNSLRPLVRENN